MEYLAGIEPADFYRDVSAKQVLAPWKSKEQAQTRGLCITPLVTFQFSL